jgi:hypothetical protein
MQDQYSGYSYPGYAETEPLGEQVYDGFGNPLGEIPIVSDIVRGVGRAVGGLIPGLPGLPGLPGFPGAAQPSVAFPQFPGAPYPRPFPFFRRPWPLGWQRPQLPYTGLGPRRLYMRCAVWPGPSGLVPAFAQTAQAAALQQAAQMAALQAAGMGRRRRRHRRRR